MRLTRRGAVAIVLAAFASVAWAQEVPDWMAGMPGGLRYMLLGIAAWQWIGLAAVCAAAFVSSMVARWIAVRVMRARDRMAPSPLLEPTRSALRRAAGILGGVLIVYPLLPELALRPRPEKLLLVVLEALTIGAAVMLAYALWDVVCDTIETRTQGYSTRAERLLVPMTRKFMRFMILVGGLLIALGAVFQVNIAGLIAGLGIGGLVIALAAKDSVENVFGSLTLLFDMPFAIGDWVKIDKIEGVVEEVNLRSTRIRTFEDTVINLPNANLIRASVENFGLRRMRRQKFYLRLSYDNDADKISALAQAIRDYLAAQDNVVTDKSIVELADLDETSMAMLVQCHFLADSLAEEMSMRAALMEQILRLRKQLKFDFVAAPRPKG